MANIWELEYLFFIIITHIGKTISMEGRGILLQALQTKIL